ncbi:DMT family transporter [Chryseobacterium kwangjuense]|uniref:Transporter n=1 Tax=Chryseobacterium kwangjuense TaxID=267125 RepID=A0A135WH73_9FLAO|nr:DMT family transporter [Chryseobacterium kwangjuense]KXH84254.1 transporter [Chryseobacterium kwangjuense]
MMTKQLSKDENLSGWINGFIGVVLFSGGLPATKLAVMEMSPTFVTIVRAAVAGLLALMVLWIGKEKRPVKNQLVPLLLVSVGCVIGFPLLSALALQYLTSAHSIVFLGMLPLATAVFGVFRGGERPHPAFWLFSVTGSVLVIGYAVAQGISASPVGDILMLLAVILCGMGYAEGAKLSKTLGGWQVISWALVLALPVMIPLFFIYLPDDIGAVSSRGWFGMGYISLFSMFIGFIFWYKGLAQGGIATVGQLQLLQPFFGLGLAAYFLHEQVSLGMIGITIGVILCVVGTKRFAK